jgi:hypothetical protein
MTETLPEVPAGDSQVQRDAETEVVTLLSAKIGVGLAPASIRLSDKTQVEVDAVSEHPPVMAEIWAHQGPPKSAQKNKVLTDALKLTYVEAARDVAYRKILCFTDEAARRPFLGDSWYASALRHYGIELLVVDIEPELRDKIIEAQKRQYR